MLLLGIDLGTSFIKVSVVDSATQQCLVAVQYPEKEVEIISPYANWAEQSPETWWQNVRLAISKAHSCKKYDPQTIGAIGIAYQMHGLVAVDKHQNVLRNSIIWCDSRAVEIGKEAFDSIGQDVCLTRLLNSPGNFTASKLAWVKKNEPQLFEQIDKVMLPGDFIAMKLTGEISTSISALSEGVFWDFQSDEISANIMNHFGFNSSLLPDVRDVFSVHGILTADVAQQLSLPAGIPVSYKAGDQPNNALSLNVLQPGEVAATAGTSGVIYGVSDELSPDPLSRINPFAHVNYTLSQKRLGVLLCINGTGICNRWIKDTFASSQSYEQMNAEAAGVAIGSNGLQILPFGNGAERMLNNKVVGSQINNINLNTHGRAHLFRATQEGIAYAFRYGLDIMRSTQMNPQLIKAGLNNMFLSEVFTEAFVHVTGIPVELYKNDGSVGAALGAGIGVKVFDSTVQAFSNLLPLKTIEPQPLKSNDYEEVYQQWLQTLNNQLIDNELEILCQQSL